MRFLMIVMMLICGSRVLFAKEASAYDPATIVSFETTKSKEKATEVIETTLEEGREFLKNFTPEIASKNEEEAKVMWALAITGMKDLADVKAHLDLELKLLFSDEKIYHKLEKWEQEAKEPIEKRQFYLLKRDFKENLVPKELKAKISTLEAELEEMYGNFRSKVDDKEMSENEINDLLQKEVDVKKRKKIWVSSKEVGDLLAPKVLELVKLRNQVAKYLGYANFFQMQLDLQEIDWQWLLKFFNELSQKSEKAYLTALQDINKELASKFKVNEADLGPWAWSDSFCQQDPLVLTEFEGALKNRDLPKIAVSFFDKMGFNVTKILCHSDLYEKPGKNQHAFCINIDRDKDDVRILTNLRPNIKWLDTILHELGHAIYELNFNHDLPWLLKSPPHIFVTEAVALFLGRQSHSPIFWHEFLDAKDDENLSKLQESLRRQELVFSRFAITITMFESELYSNPDQDLNALWWSLVEKYQRINPPKDRAGRHDWAAKFHISLSPVYYHSYLLGNVFASAINEKLEKTLFTKESGNFLKRKLFFLGNSLPWYETIKSILGHELQVDPWINEFGK